MHIKYYFVKLQTTFSQELLSIGCGIFLKLRLSVKHVPLGFNTLLAPPVCILRVKLWKVFIKSKIVMFLTFVPFF